MKICDAEGLGGKGVNEGVSLQVCTPAAKAAPASAPGASLQKHFEGFGL